MSSIGDYCKAVTGVSHNPPDKRGECVEVPNRSGIENTIKEWKGKLDFRRLPDGMVIRGYSALTKMNGDRCAVNYNCQFQIGQWGNV